MSTEQLPTEIVSVIPAHLDSAHVRWLSTLSTTTLESLLRAQCDMDRYARAGDTAQAQSIQFVLRERGPLQERIRAASAHEMACLRTMERAQRAEQQARLAVEAAVCARLKLEGLEQEHAA